VRCTFDLFNKHLSTNIMVLCTFQYPPHSFSSNSLGALNFIGFMKSSRAAKPACRQAGICRNAFEKKTIGAEHRNIYSQSLISPKSANRRL
jgi:hypothetical protein